MPERPYAMRLRYSEAGRQFFFITLCLEGRKAVLSTLEEGAKRPLLSRYGRTARRARTHKEARLQPRSNPKAGSAAKAAPPCR